MCRHNPRRDPIVIGLVLSLLCGFLWASLLYVRPVQAGSGPTIIIPPSDIVPVMDGVCSPAEYIDATQVTVTVGISSTFPVYMKHTSLDVYFCFGDETGLPLPNGGEPQVAVYIDPEGDGSINQSDEDDFGVWMPYNPDGSPWGRSWGENGFFRGTDPGGWEAVKHQTLQAPELWQVEFRISSQTLGGWQHTVGLALFYHWWRWESDDYSWPSNGIWASAQYYGNGDLATDSVSIVNSATIPLVDGECGSEYSDASTIKFDTSSGIATAYLEHSQTDLFVCLNNLAIPIPDQRDEPNAALYIDRTGTGGDTPSASDIAFTISYSGTVHVGTGDGIGFTGPDPGGYDIELSRYSGGWDAEFHISSTTIGSWWFRSMGLSVAEQSINSSQDDYGWPIGYSNTVPNTWGEATLTGLGGPPIIYLPLVIQGRLKPGSD